MDIYLETTRRWGVTMQLDVAVEECAELIMALQKWKRKQKGTPNANVTEIDIIGEAVDVEIMIRQLKRIFGNPTLWNTIRKQKLQRMLERLK